MNYSLSDWVVLMLSGVVALIGLIFAARGHDAAISAAGWLLFAFGALYAIRLGGKIAGGDSDERG